MTYEQERVDARRFRNLGPRRLAIKRLVNKLLHTGSASNEERPGRSGIMTKTVQSLNKALPGRWNCRTSPRICPTHTHSFVLTPSDVFDWGFIKNKVYIRSAEQMIDEY